MQISPLRKLAGWTALDLRSNSRVVMLRIHQLRYLLALVLPALLILAACTPTTSTPPTVTPRTDYKIGLITNAGATIRDGTFNEAAYAGAVLAGRDYGINVAYQETIEDKDYATAIAKMIADGRNIVITVGFQMIPQTIEAAKANPKVFFIGIDQDVPDAPSNFVGVNFREDQGGFIAGALAGMMTTSKTVGIVAGVKIPPVERFAKGFENGVRYVASEVKVVVEFANSFSSIDEGRSLANRLIEQNVDVLFGAGGLTGSSAIAYAAGQQKFVIGVDSDEFRTTFREGKQANAEYILTSALKRVDTGVLQVVKSILDGTFKGGTVILGAESCGITYAPFHLAEPKISATVKGRLERIWQALATGQLQTGVAEGSTPPVPLAAGATPEVAANAPKLESCNRN